MTSWRFLSPDKGGRTLHLFILAANCHGGKKNCGSPEANFDLIIYAESIPLQAPTGSSNLIPGELTRVSHLLGDSHGRPRKKMTRQKSTKKNLFRRWPAKFCLLFSRCRDMFVNF